MLIRSQDNAKLINLNSAKCISISKYNKTIEIWCDGKFLAEYSTEEKAIKVLDMIEEGHGREVASGMISMDIMAQTVKDMGFFGVDKDTAINSVIKGCIKAHTFQMPADDEVEDD